MILLIDNYDSFSYNLYQLIGEISADIKVIRNDAMTVDEIKKEIEKIDRAIFCEHMADFLDWQTVRSLEKEKAKLEAMIGITHEPEPMTKKDKLERERWQKEEEERRKRYVEFLMRG